MTKIVRLPGLIDAHVHLRDPGATQKEDFETGTRAALAGGFVYVCDMPNNVEPTISAEALEEKERIARERAVCDFGLYFGASQDDNTGEFAKVVDRVVGLKVYMDETTGTLLVEDEGLLEEIFTVWPKDKPLLVHAEGGTVEKALRITRKIGGRKIHFCHISTRREVEVIRDARGEGLEVTFEVTPHHLFLSKDDASRLGPYGRMKPPLRDRRDVEFLWKNLKLVDMIATDHAPHTRYEKESEAPPFGVTGLETCLPLVLTAVSEGKLEMRDVVRLLCEGPRKVLSLPEFGDDTFVEVDLDEEYRLSEWALETKCQWSPFTGQRFQGRVKKVVIRGEVVFNDGRVMVEAGFGEKVESEERRVKSRVRKSEVFQEKLDAIVEKNNSLVCVGLDSDFDKIPEHLKDSDNPIFEFNKAIVDSTHDLVCAYKPNSAFYEAQGAEGVRQLKMTCDYIRETYPGVPIILDAKRADIGNTNGEYVKFVFDYLGADAVTLHPYLGFATLEPFLARREKGCIVLCRTSNPGAGEFQDLSVGGEVFGRQEQKASLAVELRGNHGRKAVELYKIVANRVATEWNKDGNCMLVVGATYPAELASVRKIAGDMTFLVPGIGAQGGDVGKTVKAGLNSKGAGMIINSARGIIFASTGKDFADRAREEVLRLRDEINKYRNIARSKDVARESSSQADIEGLVLRLHDIGAIKFGEFTLKSGKKSPYYIDLRSLGSHVDVLGVVASCYARILESLDYDVIAGVPYTGIPIATAVALKTGSPMIFSRKEHKGYGTDKIVEGDYRKGQRAVLIDDIITDGASKLETRVPLQEAGLKVYDTIVLLDRGQGGPESVRREGLECHSVFEIHQALDVLFKHGRINQEQFDGCQRFIDESRVPDGVVSFSVLKPTYNIAKSWEDNYRDGPEFAGSIPPLPKDKSWKFLGFNLISPLGIAAGPLPNYKWVSLYQKLGFGSLTHKTVRTEKHESYPKPNIVYVDVKGGLDVSSSEPVRGVLEQRGSVSELSITNSFGNPCFEPSEWMEEVRRERAAIPDGQLLSVSVYGTNKEGMSLEDLAQDYANCALMAKYAGAQVIEINLSCPNVFGDEDPNLYASPTAAGIITKTVKQFIGSTPLVLKVGYYDSYNRIVDVLREIGGHFDAVSAINTISKTVVDERGRQALPGRDVSGICGAAIREFGLEMVRDFVRARDELGLKFEVVGTGGVMKPSDVMDYLEAGASHVHCATGAMWNPYLAYEFEQWLRRHSKVPGSSVGAVSV